VVYGDLWCKDLSQVHVMATAFLLFLGVLLAIAADTSDCGCGYDSSTNQTEPCGSHDSAEDAKAALELVQLKLKYGSPSIIQF